MKHAVLFSVFAVMLALPTAFAHGTGESYEEMIGNLLVDVGYDQSFTVGKDTLLDFSLTTTKSGPVPFTSIDISVESGSQIQWSRSITKPEFGRPITSLVPEASGHWVFRTVFRDQSAVVADARFDVEIVKRALPEAIIPVPAVFGAIILLLTLFLWLSFRRSRI